MESLAFQGSTALVRRFADLFAPHERFPDEYPNHLAHAAPYRPALPRRGLLLLGLMLVALVPRVVVAWKVDHVCPDGTHYIALAKQIEAGTWGGGLLQGNLFSLVLAGLHGLGLPFETAGKLWGVLCGTLVVLPMFGWVRRQFDDRVAALACLLVAVHPKLIEWSPELVRDPTFWLLFTTTLYAWWRGLVEVRPLWLFVGAAAAGLAVLTRPEGLLLAIPLTAWAFGRTLALRHGRGTLAAAGLGLAAAAALGGGALHAARPETNWAQYVHVEPLKRGAEWLRSFAPGDEAPVPSAPGGKVVMTDAGRKTSRVWAFVHTLERGLHPLFVGMLLVGYLARRRLFDRWDHVPLFLLVLAWAMGVWIQIWATREASSRHVLPIVLVSARCMAFGLVTLVAMARTWSDWITASVPARVAPLALVGALAAICLTDALWHDDEDRVAKADLGRWIVEEFGESRRILGVDEQTSLLGYYAQGTAVSVPVETGGPELLDRIAAEVPDLVIINSGACQPAALEAVLTGRQQLGFEQVDPDRLPPRSLGYIVLLRASAAQTERGGAIRR